MLATGRGHKQMCACFILKCMHIIHHLDGRELLFMLPLSDQDLFHMVEEKVYRVIGSMLAAGFPIIEFVGGRKNKDSHTKSLSKPEVSAAEVYDKLRFRIVTKAKDEIFPVLQYLSTQLFPFRTLYRGRASIPFFIFAPIANRVRTLRRFSQRRRKAPMTLSLPATIVSPRRERPCHPFCCGYAVRIPRAFWMWLPRPLVDTVKSCLPCVSFKLSTGIRETLNELGDASHAKYKERQKHAVMRRLQLGESDAKH